MFDQLDPTPSDSPSGSKQSAGRKLLGITITTLAFAVPLALFLILANAIRSNGPLPGDLAVLQIIHLFANPVMDHLMIGITMLGDAEIVVPLLAIVAAILYLKFKKRKQAVFLALAAGGTAAINVAFKHVFQRDRPELWQHLVNETSFSFPSGHAMITSSLALTLIILCCRFPLFMCRLICIHHNEKNLLIVSFEII